MSTNPFDPSIRSAPGDSSSFDLTGLDEEFDAVKPADLEEVPDGKYQVRVFKAALDKSQKGDPMLKWDLVVISGPLAGRHIFKNAVITQASLPFVKGDLKIVGLQLTKFSELPGRLGELLDLTLEVTKRTKGEYTNVYFNKLLNIPPGDGIGHPGEPAPF